MVIALTLVFPLVLLAFMLAMERVERPLRIDALGEQVESFLDTARPDSLDELRAAEAQLSAYRSAVHRRLEAATGELIARYHQDPRLCLSAPPPPPPRLGPVARQGHAH